MQRVSRAHVSVGKETVGQIGRGFLVLLGVAVEDEETDAERIAAKISGLRIFEDEDGQMNLDLHDVEGEVLLISQFTLLGDARKGRRPSFAAAAPGPVAQRLYERVAAHLRANGLHVECGRFGAHMQVELVNNGPVTILLDSTRVF